MRAGSYPVFLKSLWRPESSPLLRNLLVVVGGSLLLWLGGLVGWDKPVLAWGLWPFLAGDALKILLASLMAPTAWRLLAGRGGHG